MKTMYDLSISLLTPLHIGSGKELLHDYDYVARHGKTWVVNPDAIFEDIFFKDGNLDERMLGQPAARLLRENQFREDSKHFRYVLAGQPRSKREGAVLREQYKNVFSKPYIPGSSLKGALRTVLAWHGYQEQNLKLNLNDMGRSSKWAAQQIEQKIFGKNPNFDLFRGLQVADTESIGTERLQIINAQVVTGHKEPGAPIEMEALRSDTTLKTTIGVDEFLHSKQAEQTLGFGKRWTWLHELPNIAQRYGLERISEEREWFRKRDYDQIAGFYEQLENALKGGLGQGRFLLHIGWGGGWQGKTIGKPLQQDVSAWEKFLDSRLSPSRFKRRRGDEFPKSRRTVVANQVSVAPLGWCLVEMKKRK